MSTPVKQNKGQLYNTVTMYFKHLYCLSTHYLLLNLSLTAIDIQKQNEISTWCEQIFFHYTWSSKQKEINVLTELIPLHVSVGMQHHHLVTDEQALVTGANLKINAYPSKYTHLKICLILFQSVLHLAQKSDLNFIVCSEQKEHKWLVIDCEVVHKSLNSYYEL